MARDSGVVSAPTDVGVPSATWSLELLASILLLASLLLALSVLLFLFFLTMLFRPCGPFRCFSWRSLMFQFSLVLPSVLLLLFLYILLIFLFFAVVACVPTVVDASSATVAGIPAVANKNVSGVAGDLAAIVVLSIPAYNKPNSLVPRRWLYRLLVSSIPLLRFRLVASRRNLVNLGKSSFEIWPILGKSSSRIRLIFKIDFLGTEKRW